MKQSTLNFLAKQTLQQYFGYPDFRPGQLDIVLSILKRQDTLAILPTGGGKSICFQVPALIFPGLSIVVSPLISLMQDQVDHLLAKNIPATLINSQLTQSQIQTRFKQLANQQYKLLYLAPERLANPQLIKICRQLPVSMLCVDEAHCISMWGQHFRPAYRHIPQFLAAINQNVNRPQPIVTSTFTATATPLVKKEIKQLLNIETCQEFQTSFLRENLIFHNFHADSQAEKNIYLLKLLKLHSRSNGIIYCSTRIACQRLQQLLSKLKPQLAIGIYHGGLAKEHRQQTQAQFLNGQLQIIIATNAFGMGVDKADVRFVIHYQVSASLENYYQEAGRAGRDGQESYCYLLYSSADLAVQAGLIKRSFADQSNQERQNIERDKLQTMRAYALSQSCLEARINNYFTDQAESKLLDHQSDNYHCQHCYLCLKRQLSLDEQEIHSMQQLQRLNQQLTQRWQKRYSLFSGQAFLLPRLLSWQTIEALAVSQKTIKHGQIIPGLNPRIKQISQLVV